MKLKFISVSVTKVLSFFIMSSFFYMLMKQLENLIVVKKISTITIFPQARVGSRFFYFPSPNLIEIDCIIQLCQMELGIYS